MEVTMDILGTGKMVTINILLHSYFNPEKIITNNLIQFNNTLLIQKGN